MTRITTVVAAAVLVALSGGTALAQAPATNPLAGNAEAVRKGMGLFRARCADCHGIDARGVRAPDLTQVWASGRTDDGLFKTLRSGVPGTEMPAFVPPRATDTEAWQILAYLRTLSAGVKAETPRGNAENGQRIFRAQCAACHRIDGTTGGRFGPDLSRVGLSRTRDMMVKQIRGAAEDFRPGYEPVTITTAAGTIRGVKKNEDLFSVQIMDTRERIQGYEKDQVRSVVNETKSAMPVFGPDRLNESDLDDVIRYLQTLKGFDPSVTK